jgi:hypothetical protein
VSVICVPAMVRFKFTSAVGFGATFPVSGFRGEDGGVFPELLFPSLDREDISIGVTGVQFRTKGRELKKNLRFENDDKSFMTIKSNRICGVDFQNWAQMLWKGTQRPRPLHFGESLASRNLRTLNQSHVP